jgi:hypothetical protein
MRTACLLGVLLLACNRGPGECAHSDYGTAECRVQAENARARIEFRGWDVRFQDAGSTDASTWTARGLMSAEGHAAVARVAAPGPFAISVDTRSAETETLTVLLRNVDPLANVTAGADVGAVIVDPDGDSLERVLTLRRDDGPIQWIRGDIACPRSFQLAAFGDIQTGREQGAEVLAAMAEDRVTAAAEGEPLLGLLVAGDLSHYGLEYDMREVAALLRDAPVPVAVTTGNHDVFEGDVDVYTRWFGPGNYRFTLCGAAVAMLDTGDAAVAPTIEGRLPELLARGDASWLVAAMHFPPYSDRYGNGWIHEDQQAAVLARLAAERADTIIAGHVHNLVDYPTVRVGDRQVHQVIAGTGGADQGVLRPRYGWIRLRFSEEGVSTCFRDVPEIGRTDSEPQRNDEPLLCP